jgi:prolipoprotein diacylglyceryl transferase
MVKLSGRARFREMHAIRYPAPAMASDWLTRFARPRIGGRSTYTVLGFIGYGVATALGATLCGAWGLTLDERLIALMGPPISFIVVVAIATAIAGHELIVFYQTAIAGAVTTAIGGAIAGASTWRMLDVAVLGTGVFLVFGRLGCFDVAAGFWPRWRGRRLFPVQLVESMASLALVIAGLLLSDTPGRAAIVYADGYAAVRFALELVRGDPIRPFARGLSEAQWWSLALVAALAVARPSPWTLAPATALAIGAIALVARRRTRELFLPPHLRALDRACNETLRDPSHARRDTELGVGVSCRQLDDGSYDWVMSSTHAAWSPGAAARLASALFREPQLIEGRTPGLVHIITRD